MKDFNYASVLQEYIDGLPIKTDAARYGFLLGHAGCLYSFINHVSLILNEALKEGELEKVKDAADRAEAFLNALLVVGTKNANNESAV